MTDRMTKDTAGDLFVMRVRGMMANMLSIRGVEPTDEQKDLLEAGNITQRNLAEFAYDLGFYIEIGFVNQGGPNND